MSTQAGNELLDCIVIGGGSAGLSAALALARQLYQVVVFDSGKYVNERATHMHNVLTWDHEPPSKFRAAARENLLQRYGETIRYEEGTVEAIFKTQDGTFDVRDGSGRLWRSRAIVVATGAKVIYPEDILPGYESAWGTGIFACLFCHGYEERGSPSAGVLAVGPFMIAPSTIHTARMARRIAKEVTIYTNGNQNLSDEIRRSLGEKTSFKINNTRIKSLTKEAHDADVTLHFDNGESKTEGFLSHRPPTEANPRFVEQLGLELDQFGSIKVADFSNMTSVPGVFAAGDVATILKANVQAMTMGALCGGGVSGYVSAQLYQ